MNCFSFPLSVYLLRLEEAEMRVPSLLGCRDRTTRMPVSSPLLG